ncbi:3'-5' exonuclease [Neobacillus sp. NPDC093182]|uniref:3'-5' exonuclease n=1 Tax=Neobacillus sp. NPDC093182 TaxID=3364297 RepID=UPI00381DB457
MAPKNKKLTITDIQKKCIEFQPKGSLLVNGIPGSGKTTILIERARYLQKKMEKKILLLAYNRSMTSYLKQLATKSDIDDLAVDTFHSWGINILRSINYRCTYPLSSEDKYEKVRFARNIVRKQNATDFILPKFDSDRSEISFLTQEIDWMKGLNINTLEKYLATSRFGRGSDIRVTKKHKIWIFEVFSKYNAILFKNRLIDFHDVAIVLFEKANIIPKELLPDHILIDEAQDLSAMQLMVLAQFAQKSLTIGADKGQQIYKNRFSWKTLGIDIRGTRTKVLGQTFRSTKEIIQLANSFQQQDELLVKDEEYIEPTLPKRSGPKPTVMLCKTYGEEIKRVIEKVKKIRANDKAATIGLICVKNEKINAFVEAMEEQGIPNVIVNEQGADLLSPGVKLTTYFSAKGLEFDHVFVTNLRKNAMPNLRVYSGEDEKDVLSTERKKFYVAMTRAKLSLTITAVNPYSEFIGNLDKSLYVIE